MQNNKGQRARLPFRTSLVAAFGGRSVQLMLTLAAVLVLQACDAKESGFFAPAIDEGPGEVVPLPADIDGDWSINYNVVSTTCEPSLSNFTVVGEMTTTTSGTVTLDVLFPDASVPIRGTYDFLTGDYEGETGLVDIGDGLDANEMWDTRFEWDINEDLTMRGTSTVPVSTSGTAVCERNFTLTGFKVMVTPS